MAAEKKIHKPAHLKVARRLANLLLEANVQLDNEWIEGEINIVSDSLSRDTHLSVADHTALLFSSIPEQMPDGFAINPLPDAIASWVGCILLMQPVSREPCRQQTRSKLVSGTAGSSTGPTTLTLSPLTAPTSSLASSPSLSAASPRPFEQANFKPEVVRKWLQGQSKVTSDRWFKPSGQIDGKTPLTTQTVDYPRFYGGSTPASPVSTLPLDARKPSASAS
jgi:hypothetical protein